MSLVALPTVSSSSARQFPIWLLLSGAVVVAGAAFLVYARVFGGERSARSSGTTSRPHCMDLDVHLNKDGELQAVNNIDVVNKVEGRSLIQTLVPEGTSVHKGDVLVTLDSSDIQKTYDQSLLDLQAAEANLSAAKEGAGNPDLDQQREHDAGGGRPRGWRSSTSASTPRARRRPPRKRSRTKVKMAEIMLKNKEEDLAITRNLFGKGFVTAVDVKKGELDVLTCQNDLKKAESDLNVLRQYTKAKDLATKRTRWRRRTSWSS